MKKLSLQFDKQALVNGVMGLLGRFGEVDERLLGVDLTNGFVRVAELKKEEDRWTLCSLDEEAVSTDFSAIESIGDAHTAALQKIIKRNEINVKSAAIAVPVGDAIVKVLTVPLMSEEEIHNAIEYDSLWQNIVRLNEDLSQYTIFYQIIHRNPSANSMDLLFVASRKEDIERNAKVVRAAGLEPVIVDVRCFAIRNAFDLHQKDNSPDDVVAILEFGSRENYVLVLDGGAPHITDIFVRDEDRMRLARNEMEGEEAAQFFNRFAMQVSQVITSHEEKYQTRPIRTLYVVSDLGRVEHHLEHLAHALYNRNLIYFDPFSKGDLAGAKAAVLEKRPNRSAFSAALGLASRTLDIFGYFKYAVGVKNVNLLPNRDAIKKRRRGDVVLRLGAIAAVALYVLVAGGIYASMAFEHSDLKSKTISYERTKKNLDGKNADLLALIKERKYIKETIKLGEGLTTNQRQIAQILADLALLVPDGGWLHSLNYDEERGLAIVGYALSDDDVLSLVNKLSIHEEVESAELSTVEAKTLQGSAEYEVMELRAYRILVELKPDPNPFIQKSNAESGA